MTTHESESKPRRSSQSANVIRSKPSNPAELPAIRFEIELVVHEIEQKLAEANFRLQQENRLTPYMFLALIGIGGLFQLKQFQGFSDFLATNPVWQLFAVLLLLWFPAYAVIALTDVAKAKQYVKEIGVPRLAALLQRHRELAGIDADPFPGERIYSWDYESGRTRLFRTRTHKSLDVDRVLIMPLAGFRFGIQLVPPALLLTLGYIPAMLATPISSGDPVIVWHLLLGAALIYVVGLMILHFFVWPLTSVTLGPIRAGHRE